MDMDIIEKLLEAEQQPQKALALGIAVLSGYEKVSISEYCEMYYLLRKWQKKLGIGTLKSLDDLVNSYNARFKANHEFEAANEYVEERELVDERGNGQSCVSDVITYAKALEAADIIADEIWNDTMPDYTEAAAQPQYVIPIYIDPTKPVS